MLLATVALWAPRLSGPLDLRYDAGVYYTLGTSLADGHGYRLANEPGAPEAIQYPPLLAMIVAGHQWLVGSRDPAIVGHALRWTWAGLFFVYGLAVYVFARHWLRPGWATIVTLLVLLNLQLLWLSDTLFAELPFACVTMLFLLAGERDEQRGLTALLGGAAYLLRASGLALLGGWIVAALWQRRFLEAALRTLLAALPVLVWHAYVSEVEHGPDFVAPAYGYQRAAYQFYNVSYAANVAYVDPFAPERGPATADDLMRRAVDNARALPTALGESISVRAEGPLRPVFRLREPADDAASTASPRTLALSRFGFGLIGLVAAAGIGLLAADGIVLTPLVWAAALALTLATPWPSQLGRYLMPLAPITAVGLVIVMANATRLAHGLVQAAAGAAIGVLLTAEILVLGTVFTARHQATAGTATAASQRLFFYGPDWRAHDAALAWVAQAARPDAVVATSTPHRLHLLSGLRAIFPPFEADPARADRLLAAVPVDYLIVDHLDFAAVLRRYAETVVAAAPEHWRLVYGAAGIGSSVYRRAPR